MIRVFESYVTWYLHTLYTNEKRDQIKALSGIETKKKKKKKSGRFSQNQQDIRQMDMFWPNVFDGIEVASWTQ